MMLRFDTWPAAEPGTRVCNPMLFALDPNPSKAVAQYTRLIPGSLDDEQRLVLFAVCCTSVPIDVAAPMPPLRLGPEGVAVKEGVANRVVVCVTEVERG